MKFVNISWALQLKHQFDLMDKLMLLILPNYRVPSMVPY